MICCGSANLLLGAGHICAPRWGPSSVVDLTAIGTSDHAFPVRRISPARRMSAKDLTRQAHRRFAKVRSRRILLLAARRGECLLTELTADVSLSWREPRFMPRSCR